MKGWILLTVTITAFLFLAPNFFSVSDELSEGMRAAARFSLDEDIFGRFDRAEKNETTEGDDLACKGGSRGKEGENIAASAEAEGEGASLHSVLLRGGVYDKTAPFEDDRIDERLEGLMKDRYTSEEIVDYRAFAFRDRMIPMEEALTDDEVAFVFARIVSTYTVAVPIRGTLERIVFSREGDALYAYARISVRFDELAEKYHLGWLPDSAAFSLCIPFRVNDGKISVISEEIDLRCDTFYLPETLLIYGCNAAFGKKDYRTLFGRALENVFVNAGIFR